MQIWKLCFFLSATLAKAGSPMTSDPPRLCRSVSSVRARHLAVAGHRWVGESYPQAAPRACSPPKDDPTLKIPGCNSMLSEYCAADGTPMKPWVSATSILAG